MNAARLLVVPALFSIVLLGCGAAEKGRCGPSLSWAQPAWKCFAAEVEPEPEPEPEPVAKPDPEPEPEPPVVERKKDRIEILEKVQFETASAEIRSESFGLLDEVARVLSENPDITKVRVDGHTDSRGGASYNKKLSQRRAKSVRKYLIDKGIAAGRLEAKGFGLTEPLADNGTEDGMEKNRRVEFIILEQTGIEE